jgi:outer membrane receptor protein involved in Fe transport
MNRRLITAALFLLPYIKGFAQEQRQENPIETDRPHIIATGIFGKITDRITNKGIEAASVQIFARKKITDTTRNSDSLIAGMLSKPNGNFSFNNLPVPDSFRVVVTALGYANENQGFKALEGQNPKQQMEVGNIRLATTSDMLTSVTIVAQKPSLQMGIDRKIFNVDKSLTSTGGTALDIMRNIPSVSVDVDGNVQLRNSPPQIFVDGRPTILTMDQIPADDIERIELITNPSAKFDAASSGGIINVVLKQNRRFGLNGIVSAGVGTPGILNGNIGLNLRQGKFNFFTTASYNLQGGTAKGESKRQNKDDGVITDYFNQASETERKRRFQNLRFGADYFISNRNTLSFTQGFVNGKFSNLENQDQRYLDESQFLTKSGQRISDGHSGFKRSSSQVNYSHNFAKTGKKLTADITYNTGNGSNNTMISNYFFAADGSDLTPNFVRNSGTNASNQFTFQTDFENPISENAKVEMGLRTFRENNSNIYNAFSINNNTEVKLPLSTNVKYDQIVHAAYFTYSNKWKDIRYQAGLRAEYSEFDGQLIDSAQKFGYKLPLDIGGIFDGLFPSLYLTRDIGEGKEIQLNFSRRVNRPDFWDLNPYININDPLNISQGNPKLRPEYTNSMELNYNQKYASGNFLGVLYFRNNVADITRFSDTITAEQYSQLSNAAIDPNAILNTFINAQYTNRMGAELTLNQKFGNLEIVPNVNLQYRKVKAQYGTLDLSNEGFNWEGKLILNYKFAETSGIGKSLSLQFVNNYESPKIIPQGKLLRQFTSDFALRKQFLKNNKAAFTFAINDLFNTNRWGQIYDTENFYQDAYRRWNVRNFRINFSYKFGSSDFELFSGKKKSQQEDDK